MSQKDWVVVVNAGCVGERIVCECATYDDAWTAYHEQFTDDAEREELGADIMKRGPDGLTTEY